MSTHNQAPEGEFELAEAALRAALPSPPPMDSEFLASASASRMAAEQVRSFAHGVFMRVGAGPLRECAAFVDALGRTADRLAHRIDFLSSSKLGRNELVCEDSAKPINWNPAVVVRLAWPLLACLGLILVGWVSLMSTLKEASYTYTVFDDWLARATFAGLPVVGIPAGWKLLGHLQPSAQARRRYWRTVLRIGMTFASIWIPLVGYVLGAEAWDVGGGEGDDLPTGDAGGGVSLGVLMVTAGIAAEGLIAAACWNKFETTLENLCDYEVVQDKVSAESNTLIEDLGQEESTARTLQARFEDRAESIEQSCKAFEDAYVAALTPRWSPPSGGEGGGSRGTEPPTHPDFPGININRNGNGIPKEKRER